MAPNDTPLNVGFGSSTSNDNPRSGNTGSTTSGSNMSSGSSMGAAGTAGSGTTLNTGGTGSMAGGHSATCDSCGRPIGENRGIETFLARIGINEEMINNLKSSFQNVDIEEYLNTARSYMKDSGNFLKDRSAKAGSYAKENPGKVAAGVAALAVGAGLLINAIGNRDDSSSE
jgi:hypothetical protein